MAAQPNLEPSSLFHKSLPVGEVIVSFLHPKEFFDCLKVNKTWELHLDELSYWKIVLNHALHIVKNGPGWRMYRANWSQFLDAAKTKLEIKMALHYFLYMPKVIGIQNKYCTPLTNGLYHRDPTYVPSFAAFCNDFNFYKTLMTLTNADVSTKKEDVSNRLLRRDWSYAIGFAALNGHSNMVKFLVSQIDSAEIMTSFDLEDETPLHKAINHEEEAIVEFLVDEIPAEDLMNECDGETALHAAVLQDNWNILESLLKKIPSKDVMQENDTGRRALDLAVIHGKLEMLECFELYLSKEDFFLPNKDGETILHIACFQDEELEFEILEFLATAATKEDWLRIDMEGSNALHDAAHKQTPEIVEFIAKQIPPSDLMTRVLKYPDDLEEDGPGETPMHLTALQYMRGKEDALDVFKVLMFKVPWKDLTKLHWDRTPFEFFHKDTILLLMRYIASEPFLTILRNARIKPRNDVILIPDEILKFWPRNTVHTEFSNFFI